jgi:hypothetical protein
VLEICNFALVLNFVVVLKTISSLLTNQEKQLLEVYYSNEIGNLFSESTTSVLDPSILKTMKLMIICLNIFSQ